MKVRVLAPEEHARLVGLGPFQRQGPDPDLSSVVVAENDHGEILGYWCAYNAVHLEPLWVEEASRGNGVGMALWRELRKVLSGYAVDNAFAIVADTDVIPNLPLAAKLGFQRLPASILYIDLRDPGPDGSH